MKIHMFLLEMRNYMNLFEDVHQVKVSFFLTQREDLFVVSNRLGNGQHESNWVPAWYLTSRTNWIMYTACYSS
jgi:hypothetical protein